MDNNIRSILSVLRLAERLKFELRHSWLSSGRQESVAEHCWQMALMGILLHPHLEHDVDLLRTLKMVLIHDLVEAEAGDVPFFEDSERGDMKAQREAEAIDNIKKMLPPESATELFSLWHEFESGESKEARFAKALDNLEVQFQHNLADLSTWEEIEYDLVYTKMDPHCDHDAFLKAFCEAIKNQASVKMEAGGIDVSTVKARIK